MSPPVCVSLAAQRKPDLHWHKQPQGQFTQQPLRLESKSGKAAVGSGHPAKGAARPRMPAVGPGPALSSLGIETLLGKCRCQTTEWHSAGLQASCAPFIWHCSGVPLGSTPPPFPLPPDPQLGRPYPGEASSPYGALTWGL